MPSLASCTGPSSSAPASSSSPAGQPISLTWIHEQDNDLYQQLVVDFQAHYPSIQIQHTPGDPDVASHYAYLHNPQSALQDLQTQLEQAVCPEKN